MWGGTSLRRYQFLEVAYCVFGTALDTYLCQPPTMRTFPSQAVIRYYFNHAHIRRPSQLYQRRLEILLIVKRAYSDDSEHGANRFHSPFEWRCVSRINHFHAWQINQ